MFLAVIICLIVAVCFLTNPASDKKPGDDKAVSGIDEAGDSQPSIGEDGLDESQPIVGKDGNGDLQPVASEVPTPEIDTRTLFAQMPDTFQFGRGSGT